MTHDAKVNILLVDDQPAKLLSYEVILGDLRENLIKADCAKSALEQLLKTDVAVMLVDVCMPDMDGFELANMIRDHPRCKKTAIILVSAVYMSVFDRLRGYDCGAVDYVPVPIVPEVLRAKVAIFADLYRKTEQLSRLNFDLEERVLQRTAELEAAVADRARLLESEREARSTAEAANRLKDDFLATLSHELRTPINAVLGWVQLMRRRNLDAATVMQGMDVIERGVRTQVQLIDDLLDVNRITSGKLSIHDAPVDLVSVLRAALDTVAQPAQEKGVTLRTALDTNAMLRGDVIRLQQVFWNLLSNAVKFTPAGGQVELRLECCDGQAQVTVTDTGQGIKPEFLAKVFERFHQADSSTTRKQGGLGLGLAIVKHLVELHGGTIRAESAGAGSGARFIVTLPIADTAVESHDPAAARNRNERIDLSGLRILVIDDERDSREIVARMLADSGAETRSAESADAGLAVLREWRPDLLICDLGMPEKDGYSLIREVRAEGASAKIPAIALTAYTRAEDRAQALQAGYDRHLPKPLDPTGLLSAAAELALSRKCET